MTTKTERVDNTLEQILQGEDVEALLKGLTPFERTLLDQLTASIRTGEDESLVADLWKYDYTRRPPTIQEFIEDDYWLGGVLRPTEDKVGLFPTWRKVLMSDFDLDSRVHNVVITGSLGIGKTYSMVVIFLYRLALASLLRNPQNFLGLGKGSKIVYAVLSITKSQVMGTAFGDAMNFMASSPYFLEECRYNPDLKYSNFKINLGRGIYLTAGSKGWHVIGQNTMGVCLDEGNWRLEANPDTKAYQLYDEVRTRLSNRFQRMTGFLPAISILSSSARDESSFTERVIRDIENAKSTKTQKIYRFAVYQARRHLLKLDGPWFKVSYGLRNIPPRLLSGWYTEEGEPIGDQHEMAPSGSQTELVPEMYHDAFLRNCTANLQSLSGISTGGSHMLFPHTVDIERCCELSTKEGIQSPAKAGIELIPLSQEDGVELWDYLDHPKFLTRRLSRVVPIRHPDALRFAHIDLATTSLAGVSICHLVGQQLVSGVTDLSGNVFSEYRLVVEYDFILTICAGKTKPISFEKIQKFFFWLRDICNYRFGMVTADTFQSEMPLQMLESRGFTVDKQSVDRKKDAYYSLRTAFEDLRIRMYKQRQFTIEIEALRDNPDKIDHPPEGSKDTTDAVAGAYMNAINSQNKTDLGHGHQSVAVYAPENVQSSAEKPLITVDTPYEPPKTSTFYG